MNTPKIAEIVTFRTRPEVADESVAPLANALAPFLRSAPGFLARNLSQAQDGTWTDHVIWQSLDDALSAGQRIMQEPCAIGFMAIIDEASVRISHATIVAHQTTEAG